MSTVNFDISGSSKKDSIIPEKKSSVNYKRLSLDLTTQQFIKRQDLNPVPKRERSATTEQITFWNAPQASYVDARKEIGFEAFQELINEKTEWVFNNQSFTKEGVEAFNKHLQASHCRVTSVKFINCALEPKFMERFCDGLEQNGSVRTVHIEGCVMNTVVCTELGFALEKGCFGLKNLHFINVTLPNEGLSKLIHGIISRDQLVSRVITKELTEVQKKSRSPLNLVDMIDVFKSVCEKCKIDMKAPLFSFDDLLQGFQNTNEEKQKVQYLYTIFVSLLEKKIRLETLWLEGCGLNQQCEHLGLLIQSSTKLKELNLQGNSLGSNVLNKLQKERGGFRASDAITAITSGLEKNLTLDTLILSSNHLSVADWKVLYQVIGDEVGEKEGILPKNGVVTINVTGNGLEKQIPHTRLITCGSSPRSLAAQQPLEQVPVIKRKKAVKVYDTLKPHSRYRKITLDVFPHTLTGGSQPQKGKQ